MRLILIILLSLTMGVACSNKAKRGDKKVSQEKITSDNPAAQAEFDDAKALLESGDFSGARDRLQQFQATYPNDGLALVAELYLGRALIADPADRARGLAMLQDLTADKKVDGRVRFAAMGYAALSHSLSGSQEDALASLKNYPGPSMSPLVLDADQTTVWALVSESFQTHKRSGDAVVAYGALWGSTDIPAEKMFAVSRGFDAAQRLEDAELESFSNDPDMAFVRAVGGATLLERWLSDDTSRRQRRALRALLSRIDPDLLTIGATDRADHLDRRIDAFGPVQKIVVGVVLPLSGANANVGKQSLEAVLFAAEAFKKTRNDVTLLVKDSDKTSPKDAFKYFDQQGVGVVVGPLDTKTAEAFATQANSYQIPMIALAKLTADTAWSKSFFVDPTREIEAVVDRAIAAGDSRFAIVLPDIVYGRSMAKTFRDVVTARGATIVLDREYKRSTTNFTTLANTVAASKPDAVFIPDTGAKVAEVTAFFANANVWGYGIGTTKGTKRINVHYLGTSLWHSKALVRQSAKYVDGASIPVWFASEIPDETSKQFASSFVASVGREPSVIDAFAYDATMMAIAAASVDTDPTVIQKAIGEETFLGVTGPTELHGETFKTGVRFVEVDAGDFVGR